jgi:hypothetical protein
MNHWAKPIKSLFDQLGIAKKKGKKGGERAPRNSR